LQDVVLTLKHPEVNIIPVAKDLVKETLNESSTIDTNESLGREIKNLIKDNKKLEFDIEIK
jgi:hypothetical protein